jgi:hypothetical protein
MAQVNVFLLLPESTPSNQWMLECYPPDEEDSFSRFTDLVSELSEMFDTANIEVYEGFYDSENISNYLHAYSIVEDYYPSKPQYVLRKLIADNCCYDWREAIIQADPSTYRAFGQPVPYLIAFLPG